MESKANRVAATLAGLVPAPLSLVAAGVLCAYLTEYDATRRYRSQGRKVVLLAHSTC